MTAVVFSQGHSLVMVAFDSQLVGAIELRATTLLIGIGNTMLPLKGHKIPQVCVRAAWQRIKQQINDDRVQLSKR